MVPKSKFDQLIAETDSTLWPIPGQAMNNKAAAYKQLPSLQSILQSPEDTDPAKLINSAQSFGTPLEHVLEKFADAFRAVETLKGLFVDAKSSPVYISREKQQKQLDTLIERMENLEKYLYNSVEQLENLTLASFDSKDIMKQ